MIDRDGIDRIGRTGRDWFDRNSRALANFLDLRMEPMVAGWIVTIVAVAAVKVATAPVRPDGVLPTVAMLLPFLLVAISPVAGLRVAQSCFPRGGIGGQPAIRLCRYGAWRPLDLVAARNHPAFGARGFMVSLIAGIALNVPFRSVEFLLAVPAMGAGSPGWAQHLLVAMTIDVVAMNFFYIVCFVMALRAVSIFPRMLLFAWSLDLMLQLTIARSLGSTPDLPANVARALLALLDGNVHKVLISAGLWLPYLILSERVNVTFRSRVRA